VFSKRARGGGFLKTLLLRRVGSTLYAGKRTSETLLGIKPENLEVEEEEDIAQESGIFKDMPDDEKKLLKRFLDQIDDAKKTIDEVPRNHPFALRYDKIEPINWEQCSKVLDSEERRRYLMKGW
jgi:hypothetical protein